VYDDVFARVCDIEGTGQGEIHIHRGVGLAPDFVEMTAPRSLVVAPFYLFTKQATCAFLYLHGGARTTIFAITYKPPPP
jgi:hypothetical protein